MTLAVLAVAAAAIDAIDASLVARQEMGDAFDLEIVDRL